MSAIRVEAETAAFEVVEKVRSWIFSRRQVFKRHLQAAALTSKDGTIFAWEELIFALKPEHICRAALHAVEENA